jgi:hypothetical protein
MLRPGVMKAKIGALALTIFATATLASTSVSAQEEPGRLWQLRFDVGLSSTTDHLQPTGGGHGPPAYGAVTVERVLTGRLAVDASVAVVLLIGPAYGLAARFAAVQTRNVRLSVAAGPLLVDSEDSSLSQFIMFAQADVTGEVRFQSGFVVAAGAQIAFALQSAGTMRCGADTCSAWAERGDRIITGRVGLGCAF